MQLNSNQSDILKKFIKNGYSETILLRGKSIIDKIENLQFLNVPD